MSAAQQAVAQQVKYRASNVFTILMWSMAIFIIIAAAVAGLYVCAFAISGSPSLAQMSGQPEVLERGLIARLITTRGSLAQRRFFLYLTLFAIGANVLFARKK